MSFTSQAHIMPTASMPASLLSPPPSVWMPQWRDSVDWSRSAPYEIPALDLSDLGLSPQEPGFGFPESGLRSTLDQSRLENDDGTEDNHSEAPSSNNSKNHKEDTVRSLDERACTDAAPNPGQSRSTRPADEAVSDATASKVSAEAPAATAQTQQKSE